MDKDRYKRKLKSGAKRSGQVLVSTPIQEELIRFIEYHPPNRFNRNLRKMLIDYLMQEGALEDFHLKDLLYDLQGLFELLDAIEVEGEL